MNSLEQLHKEHNIHPELKNFYLTYQYVEKDKSFKFLSYRCTSCGRSFKHANTLPGHNLRCPSLNRPPKYKSVELTDEVVVVTKQRTEWRPFDMNQKNSYGTES